MNQNLNAVFEIESQIEDAERKYQEAILPARTERDRSIVPLVAQRALLEATARNIVRNCAFKEPRARQYATGFTTMRDVSFRKATKKHEAEVRIETEVYCGDGVYEKGSTIRFPLRWLNQTLSENVAELSAFYDQKEALKIKRLEEAQEEAQKKKLADERALWAKLSTIYGSSSSSSSSQ